MTENKCLLCESKNITIVEELDTKIITDLYQSRANINVKQSFTDIPTISLCECNSCKLRYYYPLVLGDGHFYEQLQDYEGYYLEEKYDYLEAAKFITPSDDVLEVGCATAFFTAFIKPKSYTGIEFNDKAIKIAQSKNINVQKEFLEVHAEKNAEKYDVVCFFQVLEHVENPKTFLESALKCLRKGGKLILAVPAEDSFISRHVNYYLNMPPHHATRWYDNTLNNIAGMFDMKLIRISHEPLHKIHEEFYEKVEIFQKIRKTVGIPFRTLENGIFNTFLYGVATVIAKIKLLLGKKTKNAVGQSVVVVYEKK